MKKTRQFTLLEILVCLSIIVLLMGSIGSFAFDLISKTQVKSKINAFLADVRASQMSAMIQKMDVEIHFLQKKKDLCIEVVPEDGIPRKYLLPNTKLSVDREFKSRYVATIFATGVMIPNSVLGFSYYEENVCIDLSFPCEIYNHKYERIPFELTNILFNP